MDVPLRRVRRHDYDHGHTDYDAAWQAVAHGGHAVGGHRWHETSSIGGIGPRVKSPLG